MAHDVFVCHPSEERATANAVVAKLEADQVRCWIAPRDVLPSEEWADSIVRAIGGSRLLILVFSEHSNQSRHVMREIEQAVGRAIPILPFRIGDVAPSPALEYYIGGTHWLDALTPPLEAHLERLVETVRILLPHANQPLTDDISPAGSDADHDVGVPAPLPNEGTPPSSASEDPTEALHVGGEPEPSPPSSAPAFPMVVSHVEALESIEPPPEMLANHIPPELPAEGFQPPSDQPSEPPAAASTPPPFEPPDSAVAAPLPVRPSESGREPEPHWLGISSFTAGTTRQKTTIIGAAAAVVVFLAVGSFFGLRQLTTGGDTELLGIAAATLPNNPEVSDDSLLPVAVPSSTTTAAQTTVVQTTSPTTIVATTTTTLASTTTTTIAATTTTLAPTTTTKATTTTTVVVLVARNDSYTRTDRGQVCFDVTSNDSGSGTLTVVSVGASEFGSASAASCGVQYSPPDGLTRPDAFTDVISYTMSDATGATASATLTVSVR